MSKSVAKRIEVQSGGLANQPEIKAGDWIKFDLGKEIAIGEVERVEKGKKHDWILLVGGRWMYAANIIEVRKA